MSIAGGVEKFIAKFIDVAVSQIQFSKMICDAVSIINLPRKLSDKIVKYSSV